VAGNDRWPAKKSAGKCGLNFFVTKIFFDRQTQKFMILIYKNIPPPKKGPFFFGGGGSYCNGGINRGNAQPVARRTIFGERSEQLRRTILASETRYTVYTKNILQAKRAARRTVLASEAQCYLPNLGGKPLSFYFSKNPPTCWGVFVTFKKFQKITLVFFYKNS